jgi:hypothetical protein
LHGGQEGKDICKHRAKASAQVRAVKSAHYRYLAYGEQIGMCEFFIRPPGFSEQLSRESTI